MRRDIQQQHKFQMFGLTLRNFPPPLTVGVRLRSFENDSCFTYHSRGWGEVLALGDLLTHCTCFRNPCCYVCTPGGGVGLVFTGWGR